MTDLTKAEQEVIALTAIIGQIINQHGSVELSVSKMNDGLPGKELLIEQEGDTWTLSLGDV